MTWAYFQNRAAWDTYHDAKCADLGIPRPGRIQSTQAPAILNQWTDAAVNPTQVKGTGNVTAWVARVTDSDIATYNLGLNIPDSAVVFSVDAKGFPTGIVTFTFNNKTYTSVLDVGFNWRKPKPPTYTMDGVTYNTATGFPV